MHQINNVLEACNGVFLKPNGVFKALKEKNNWSWVPFLIIMALGVLINYLYFTTVDVNWYQDQIIQSQYADVSPSEQDMVRQSLSQSAMMMFALVSATLGAIIFAAIYAAYFTFVGRRDDECVQGYTDWYGFVWWISMPSILNSLIGLVLLLVASDHQIMPTTLLPLSLAYLLNIDMGSDWFGIGQFIRLDLFWTIYLTVVGLKQWTQFSNKQALIAAVIPHAIIIAISLLFVIF